MRGIKTPAVALIAIIIVAICVNFALVFTSPKNNENAGHTTYSPARGGLKALYITLKKSGRNVSRKETSLRVPLPADAIFISIDPEPLMADPEEMDALAEWIEKGGEAVFGLSQPVDAEPIGIITGQESGGENFRRLKGKQRSSAKKDIAVFTAASLSPISNGIRKLSPEPDAYITETEMNTIYHLDSNKGGIAAERRCGKGRMIVFTAVPGLENENLPKADNLRLLLNIIETAGPEKKIIFDEYHHGFTRAEFTGRSAFLRLLVTTPYGICALLLAMSGILWMLNKDTLAIRRHRAWVVMPSSMDHIGAVAALYERLNARGFAAWRLLQSLRRELVDKLALPFDTPLAKALENLESRYGIPDSAARAKLAAAENSLLNGNTPSARETLALARAIESIKKEFRK